MKTKWIVPILSVLALCLFLAPPSVGRMKFPGLAGKAGAKQKEVPGRGNANGHATDPQQSGHAKKSKGDLNACRQAAQKAYVSGKLNALSERFLSLGICENLADPEAIRECRNQAMEDFHDAMRLSAEQYSARLEVCDRLGGGPYDPEIDPKKFTTTINNQYFPLEPNTTLIYEGETDLGLERDEFEVTTNTLVIMGVTCVEVHDVVTLDGEVIEDTLDWFAQDLDGNVWYFGENSREIEDGLVVSLAGSWMAGSNGDKPGIIMLADPNVGDFYRQEFSLNNAEDVAEVISLDETVTVPADTFTNCLQTRETTPLEPDVSESKFYAPGIGNVLTIDDTTDARLELIEIVTGSPAPASAP